MGTSLTGTKPKDTYDSLIKVGDNGPLSGTAKYLSDGLGNDSALALSTAAVGVGTASPNAPLEVQADSGGTSIRVKGRAAANSGTIRFFDNASSTQLAKIESSDNSFEIGSINNADSAFLTNGTERMRITSAGNVGIGTSFPNRVLTVNGDFGVNDIVCNTAIYLGGTAAANALDDYEEGTFTPTLNFGGASVGVTYGTVAGKYTKIGNLVNFSIRMTLTSKGSSTGAVRIAGLPFTVANTGNADFTSLSIGALQNVTFVDFPMGLCIANTDYLALEESASGGVISALTNADFQNDSVVRVGGFYYTA